jgi:hypothetical protein
MSNPVLDFNLGAYIQIAYSKGTRDQLSRDFRDWDLLKACRVGDPDGRELKFMFKTGRGPASTQYSRVTDTAFAKGQQSSVSEHTAEYQDIDTTVEFDYKLWDRARKNSATYGDFLAEELDDKILVQKRQMAKDLYGDGTGVIGTAESASDAGIAAGDVAVTLGTASSDLGHAGNFEYDDMLVAAQPDGTLRLPTGGSGFYAYKVISKSRKTGVIDLQIVDSNYDPITTYTLSNIADGDFFYRVGLDATAARFDRSGAITAQGDFGKQLVTPGLESLAANDGRTVHGITMSGRTGATTESDGGTLDIAKIEEVLNEAKISAGEGAYTYKMMSTAPEVHTFFINSREADRRFNSVDDTKRGGKMFGYQHRSDFLEVYASEFISKNRLWMLPEAKTGNKVLEYHATDFETVKVNDISSFHIAVEGGSRVKKVQTFMTAKGTLICKHPAAIGLIKDFTLS